MRFAGTQMTNFMGDTMDFGQVAGQSILGRGRERRAAMEGDALVAGTGIKSLGAIQSAGFKADAIRAQGQAQSQASMAQGIGSLASGLAGGFANMGGSGGGGVSSFGATSIGTGAGNYNFGSYNTTFSPQGATSIGRGMWS